MQVRSAMASSTLLHLLVILLGFSHLICFSAVPVTSNNLKLLFLIFFLLLLLLDILKCYFRLQESEALSISDLKFIKPLQKITNWYWIWWLALLNIDSCPGETCIVFMVADAFISIFIYLNADDHRDEILWTKYQWKNGCGGQWLPRIRGKQPPHSEASIWEMRWLLNKISWSNLVLIDFVIYMHVAGLDFLSCMISELLSSWSIGAEIRGWGIDDCNCRNRCIN